MKALILFITVFFIFSVSSSLKAENDKMSFGIFAGYNNSVYNEDLFPGKPTDPLCPVCTQLSGNGFSAGVSSRLPLNFLSGNIIKSNIEIKLSYSNLPASETKSDEYPSLVDRVTQQFWYMHNIVYYNEIKYSAIGLSINYLLKPFDLDVFFIVGGGADFALTNNFKLNANLIGNDNAHLDSILPRCWNNSTIMYSEDKRSALIADEPIPELKNLRFYLNFGLGYDFFFKPFIISPGISYKTDFKLSIINFNLNLYF